MMFSSLTGTMKNAVKIRARGWLQVQERGMCIQRKHRTNIMMRIFSKLGGVFPIDTGRGGEKVRMCFLEIQSAFFGIGHQPQSC
jgi:hypothetical protein